MDKTKKFLAALVKFATSVSPAVGTNVRKLVFRLAVGFLFLNKPEDQDKVVISNSKILKIVEVSFVQTGCLGVPEFLHQLQLQTQVKKKKITNRKKT